jgi:acetylornithine deacetylase
MNPTTLRDYVGRRRERLVEIARDLVRIPSENHPPDGDELACQAHVAGFLRRLDFEVESYALSDVPGLETHSLFWPGRDYRHRPNVAGRLRGSGRGAGRSLILSGHIDTVPRGTQEWTRDPFGGEVAEGRLYGRGSNDMKAGIAAMLFIAEAFRDLDLRPEADLLIETVCDEEFGGVNGTIAGRLKGYTADAAVIPEPTFLRICPAHRGGRIAHLTFRAPGGILSSGDFPTGVVEQIRLFLDAIPEFARRRRDRVERHPMFAAYSDPAPVTVTKIVSSPWGPREPVTVPEICRIELYWQAVPGEERAQVEAQFHDWLRSLIARNPRVFAIAPEVEFPIRWLPGSAIPADAPLPVALGDAAQAALGRSCPVQGFEAPCDMFAFHAFGIPAVLFGPSGANTHAPDEYVEIESMVEVAHALLLFTAQWCGA